MRTTIAAILGGLALLGIAPLAFAQGPAPGRTLPISATLVSPEVSAAGSATLRLYAPSAQRVTLAAGDLGAENPLTRATNGVWSVTLRPAPGTYRYAFSVDGLSILDPRNTSISTANGGPTSVLHINGSKAGEDRLNVPHGHVGEVFYPSPLYPELRRMHVYTPPGYEAGTKRYPVLYLLHGGGDGDDSWTGIGRANFILDNLIASGAAVPMIVVMPAGHWPGQTDPFDTGSGPPGDDQFGRDFTQAIMPYVESHYRVRADANSRALAGLSMGGLQTLNIGLSNLDRFHYLGVFSSGFFTDDLITSFDAARGASLAVRGKDLKLLYFAWGSEDFLAPRVKATFTYLDSKGVRYVRNETGGGHTWPNWRDYLHDFAPRLFR